jgi:plastocyanin
MSSGVGGNGGTSASGRDRPTTSERDAAASREPAESGFRTTGTVLALVLLVSHLALAAFYRDLDAVFVAISFAVALGLLRVGRGTLGLGALVLACLNVAFWTLPATFVNLRGGAGFVAAAVPGTMAVLAVTGLLAAVAAFAGRNRAATANPVGPRWLVVGGAIALGIVLVAGSILDRSDDQPGPDDLVVITDRSAFEDSELEAEAGTVRVFMDNRDYFWHTFTIRALGVDLAVPVEATGRVTFEAAPGTYRFVCAIPGHEAAGMVGILTVREP